MSPGRSRQPEGDDFHDESFGGSEHEAISDYGHEQRAFDLGLNINVTEIKREVLRNVTGAPAQTQRALEEYERAVREASQSLLKEDTRLGGVFSTPENLLEDKRYLRAAIKFEEALVRRLAIRDVLDPEQEGALKNLASELDIDRAEVRYLHPVTQESCAHLVGRTCVVLGSHLLPTNEDLSTVKALINGRHEFEGARVIELWDYNRLTSEIERLLPSDGDGATQLNVKGPGTGGPCLEGYFDSTQAAKVALDGIRALVHAHYLYPIEVYAIGPRQPLPEILPEIVARLKQLGIDPKKERTELRRIFGEV